MLGDGTDGFEGEHPCDEVVGTGERHVKILPRAPHYEVFPPSSRPISACARGGLACGDNFTKFILRLVKSGPKIEALECR